MTNNIEIIDFFRPEGGRKNLFVTNISGNVTKDLLQETLYQEFSTFGLLFEIQVFPLFGKTSQSLSGNTDVSGSSLSRTDTRSLGALPSHSTSTGANEVRSSEPMTLHSNTCMAVPGLPTGWYAFVKFYSAIAASRAKAFLDGKLLLGQPCKISYAKRRTLQDTKPPTLYVAKCQQLANYYLGFNGWSCCLKSLLNDSDTSQAVPKVRYICSVRIDVTNHSLHSDGVGLWEAFINPEDPSSKGEVIGRVKKLAYQNALENAFSKIILVVLASGKVSVEVNTTVVDILLKKAQIDESGLVKVNELTDEPESEENLVLEEDKPEPEVSEMTDSILDDFNMQVLQELENEPMSV